LNSSGRALSSQAGFGATLRFGQYFTERFDEFLVCGTLGDCCVRANVPPDSIQHVLFHVAVQQDGQMIVRVPNDSDERWSIESRHIYVEHYEVALRVTNGGERSEWSAMKSCSETQFDKSVKCGNSVSVVVVDDKNDGRGHGATPSVESGSDYLD
jgi:hypothetical protein